MKRSDLVYHFEWQARRGEVIVAVSRGAKVAYQATKLISASLIVAGIAGLIITFQPIISTEVAYRWSTLTGSSQTEVVQAQNIVAQAADAEREQTKTLARELGMTNSSFSIYIPKISARAPIIQNVDPANQKEYMEALKQGVAQAKGSVYPGMSGGTFLFAHSSEVLLYSGQYNTVFYLLRELNTPTKGQKGDEIYVFFLDKLYKYEVKEKYIVEPNDVSSLASAKTGRERLILQTCWPPGTALKRQIIVAEPIGG